MIDLDVVCFNVAVLIGGLFILEQAADKFIDHTTKLAARLRVPSTLIALLTAGAEWEELVVVVAAIVQHEPPLAMGNILGSSISNVLGAFSLGLIFSPTDMYFDRSSKIYTVVLFSLTSLLAVYVLLSMPLVRIGGLLLVLIFIIYIAGISFAIYKGIVTPPEDDDDSVSESDLDLDSDSGIYMALGAKTSARRHSRSNSNTTSICLQDIEAGQSTSSASTPLAQETFNSLNLKKQPLHFSTKPGKAYHSTIHHTCHLIFAALTLSLSGYILSHSVITLSNTFSVSNSLLGVTVLSIATTLPEKVVAVFSGARSQSGVLVANATGSNIFLLTLCAGVLFLAGDSDSLQADGVSAFEILWMWGSSVLFFAIVLIGGKRWLGWVLLGLYLAFIVCEFTLERR